MIAGATYTLPLDIRYPVRNTDKIIITLKNESTGIKRTKRYPNDEETRLLADGRIGARLTQQDTVDLVGYVKVEAQINLKSGSVAKTTTERTFISPTLNTEMVAGAADNGENLLDGVTLELGAPITEAEGGEGTSFQPGNALELKDGILNVLTTDDAEKGNNLPITSEGARKLADNISYNDLKDRPFYEETEIVNEPLNITWDGNTEGRVVIDAEGNGEFLICKVSDLILTDEQIKKCWIRKVGRGTIREAFPVVGEEWDNSVEYGFVTEHAVYVNGVVFVRQAEAIFDNIVYPEAGIYFDSFPFDKDYTHDLYSEEPIEHSKTVVHKLDKKYLPDGVGGGGVFVVEVDWDTDKVITPLNEIRDAWLSHKMIVLSKTNVKTTYVYTLQKGTVYGENDEGVTGTFCDATFVCMNYGTVYFVHIDNEGNVIREGYEVEMSTGK